MSSKKEALSTATELLEVMVDHFFVPDGLAKDIPVVGSLTSLINICTDFKNRRFAIRVSKFLSNFDSEEFDKFKKAIVKKSNKDLGEEILSVIEILEKEVQVDMVARATKMHIALLEEGHAPESVKYILDQNIHIIKQLDSHLLRGLHEIYSGKSSCQISLASQLLLNLGLLEQKVDSAMIGIDNSKLSFRTCEFGRSFYSTIVCDE